MLANIPFDDLVKLTAVGSLDPDFSPEYHWLEEKMNERFFFAKFEEKTSLLIRPEDYQNDNSLKGEFIRRVLASELPQADKDRVILNGLRALREEEIDL